jgi:ubiquitin C-terminal hydrolase
LNGNWTPILLDNTKGNNYKESLKDISKLYSDQIGKDGTGILQYFLDISIESIGQEITFDYLKSYKNKLERVFGNREHDLHFLKLIYDDGIKSLDQEFKIDNIL